MASYGHTYDSACLLQPESNQFTRRASEVSLDPPKIREQFFYSSALPIDDPLSPVPPPSTSSAAGPSKVPPRPFSIRDNNALEEAWQIVQKTRLKTQTEEGSELALVANPSIISGNPKDRKLSVKDAAKTNQDIQDEQKMGSEGMNLPEAEMSMEDQTDNISSAGRDSIPVLVTTKPSDKVPHVPGHPDLTLVDDPDNIPFDDTMPVGSDEIGNDEFEGGTTRRRRHRSPFHRREQFEKPKVKESHYLSKSFPPSQTSGNENFYGSSPSERDTTGTPFVRAASRLRRSRSRAYHPPNYDLETQQHDGADSESESEWAKPTRTRTSISRRLSDRSELAKSESDQRSRPSFGNRSHTLNRRSKSGKAYITVGISRLHVVEIPELRMGPIYWDPVHDICSVVRGTWFYKDTMMPVESDVANQIEEGYEYMKPWTQTYTDELNSCLEIGAEAELKIVHKIWPVEEPNEQVRSETKKNKMTLFHKAEDQLNSDEQDRKRAIIAATKSENRAAGIFDDKDHPVRLYAKSSVIYANARDAQILRPSLLPSVVRGRRPLASIRKGRSIGIPVVRGFDHKAWEKLYPPTKRAAAAAKAREGLEALKIATSAAERPKGCPACSSGEEKSEVTDLVLVIHGIGQKLSERVESFHFTHAINAFRRQINMELEAEAVKPWLRPDSGRIMVLPVNWRSTLKLEDGGPNPEPNRRERKSSKNQYTLKDITAESIPAVRNLISDVMLDIPYYLSHHKKQMIAAVIKEANRIFRLWIKNNPGFGETGRVHLIAHSLGSVMALDILSKQPTSLPKDLNLKSWIPRDDMFEFDTKNLFFCGSPAGFFLLLNTAPLLPRKGRNKPGAEGEDISPGIAGEVDTYGCLAVDNLYNIMHYNDPIAYRLNACVDVDYAASLQPASVPSAANSWMQSISSVFRTRPFTPITPTVGALGEFPSRPLALKMPSTLEMETHDFTREEIAEKRMHLLNDNGQIDYTLHSGGGPLEIQYLNMLSAHSSYWTLQDFVRFLVVEIGRKSGKNETMAAMKAAKKVRGKG